ncbi:MAG: NAD(P)/FAD-dependent oxidoreductase [Sphingomonas bacterium]
MPTKDTAAVLAELEVARKKYHIEREKRLNPKGPAQYRQLSSEFAQFAQDPYTPRIERDPVEDLVDVAIIGGGFGGLLVGARLREAGLDRIRIVDQGGDIGGVWYWNRYPGVACDVESYVYMPLLEETGYMPSEKYARGAEIHAHAQRIARHFDLYTDALLHSRVTGVDFNDDDELWVVRTDRGDAFRARYVVMTGGGLSDAKLPGVEGIETFKGHLFHTTRWDYGYTGGDSYGGLTGLADKRVGVVGTGATALQVVPKVGEHARQLLVFQRTPSAVHVRGNRPTDPEWVRTLKPGWQRERIENFSAYIAGADVEADLVGDAWTWLYRSQNLKGGALDEAEDFAKMEEVRARIANTVKDPEVAEKLKPWYPVLCKRPGFHDEYLDSFNRPNVTLVDTDGKGIERITEKGVVADGVEYELDCLIFASGFTTPWEPFAKRYGYDVRGRGGLAISEKFRDGMSTLYGMQTHDFPNFFLMGLNQVGNSVNQTHVLDVQSRHIAAILAEAERRGAALVEPSVEAENGWVDTICQASRATAAFLNSCTPSYFNNEGQADAEKFRRDGFYSPGIMAFDRLIGQWRASGQWEGLEFDGTPAAEGKAAE